MIACMSTRPGLFETLYTTRALRRFRSDPVPDEVLFQVLDAAIRAPSGQNAQDWRFILVRDRAVLAQMEAWSHGPWLRYLSRFGGDPAAIDALPRSQRLSLRSVEHLVRNLAQCPVVIVVLGLKGRHGTPGGSAFPAVQNLLLAARALGLGGSVFNFPLSHEAELRELLAIPQNNQIYCLLPIGYPTDRHGPVKRKPVKDVVYLEKFGERWRFAEAQPESGWQSRWVPE
jgi:nitroreductase